MCIRDRYLWMRSSSSSNYPSGSWNPAPGVNDQASYTPPTVSATTHFIRLARRAGFTTYEVYSNVVSINILSAPIAQINGVSSNAYIGYMLNASATPTSGTTYEWDFNGDGIIDAFGQNASFTYNVAGTYNIILTTTGSNGCSASTSATIAISNPIIANIIDPCDCDNPNVFRIGGVFYNYDFILINSNPGESWTLSSVTPIEGVVDASANAILPGAIIPEISPGVYFLDIWFDGSMGWSAVATNGLSSLPTGPGILNCDCLNNFGNSSNNNQLTTNNNSLLGNQNISEKTKQSNFTSEEVLLEIFPNPFSQTTTVKYFLTQKEKINLVVYNTDGKKVFRTENLPNEIGWNKMEFKAENLPSGIYQLALYLENEVMVKNIVVVE